MKKLDLSNIIIISISTMLSIEILTSITYFGDSSIINGQSDWIFCLFFTTPIGLGVILKWAERLLIWFVFHWKSSK
ncbi:hypothetical protein L4D77_28515 [Photobacterium frigidiphilum]|uniref:hypothetical protein n=1 Tax=Photobacterium frigidiphilum TaxID=264736 RepID=UPI003D119392